MLRVAEIRPFGREPGLVAFVCQECGNSQSELIYPASRAQPAGSRSAGSSG